MRKNKPQSSVLILLGALLLIWTVYSIESRIGSRQEPTTPVSTTQPPAATAESGRISTYRLSLIAQLARQRLRSEEGFSDEDFASLDDPSDGVYVALRSAGIEEASAWTQPGITGELISAGLVERRLASSSQRSSRAGSAL